MILLVDNYDSFAYNLYQLIGSIDPNIKVIRNDEMTVDEIEKIDPNTIVISPGPGKPSEAGNIEEIIKYFYNKKLRPKTIGRSVISALPPKLCIKNTSLNSQYYIIPQLL